MNNYRDIILAPVITEKTAYAESEGNIWSTILNGLWWEYRKCLSGSDQSETRNYLGYS